MLGDFGYLRTRIGFVNTRFEVRHPLSQHNKDDINIVDTGSYLHVSPDVVTRAIVLAPFALRFSRAPYKISTVGRPHITADVHASEHRRCLTVAGDNWCRSYQVFPRGPRSSYSTVLTIMHPVCFCSSMIALQAGICTRCWRLSAPIGGLRLAAPTGGTGLLRLVELHPN